MKKLLAAVTVLVVSTTQADTQRSEGEQDPSVSVRGGGGAAHISVPAQAGTIYADILTDSMFVTSFGSGLVTGAPDAGGLWLSDTSDPPTNNGYIVVEYLTPLIDGPGDDLQVLDVEGTGSDPTEIADVFVSANGIDFTYVATIIGGTAEGFVDIAGAFPGSFNFVRVEQTSTAGSIDIDAIAAFNVADCSSFTCGNNANKLLICHAPPGNPANAHTICMSASSVPDHLEHHGGDHCGPCDGAGGIVTYLGDLDGDATVGIGDLLILFGAWGPCPAETDPCPADLDYDAIVGINDLMILLGNWG